MRRPVPTQALGPPCAAACRFHLGLSLVALGSERRSHAYEMDYLTSQDGGVLQARSQAAGPAPLGQQFGQEIARVL
jgi:hypothetical protein